MNNRDRMTGWHSRKVAEPRSLLDDIFFAMWIAVLTILALAIIAALCGCAAPPSNFAPLAMAPAAAQPVSLPVHTTQPGPLPVYHMATLLRSEAVPAWTTNADANGNVIICGVNRKGFAVCFTNLPVYLPLTNFNLTFYSESPAPFVSAEGNVGVVMECTGTWVQSRTWGAVQWTNHIFVPPTGDYVTVSFPIAGGIGKQFRLNCQFAEVTL